MRKWQSTQNKNNRNKRNYSAGGLHTSPASAVISLIFIAVLATIVSSSNAHATASTLSLSIDNSTVSVDIASVSTQGNFRKSSNSTITASTNNATGYTLSIAGNSSSDYNKLINNDDTNAKLNSITEATTESQFSALSGTAYNNMWGYLPSKHCTNATDATTCTTNTDFLPAPASTGDILDVTSTPNSTANEYTLAIGARVDSTTKIGAYTNTFNVILVANAIPYTMTFIDSTVSDMPIDINTTSMTEQVTLPSNTPTRNGYTFLGWCTVQPTINPDGNDTCSGTTYQPSSTAYLDQQSTSNDFTFYAMWGGNYTIGAITYLQDFSTLDNDGKSKVLASMITDEQYKLKDRRDNKEYWIAKMRDGNVWMTQALDLDLSTGTALNHATSDIGWSENNPNKTWTPARSSISFNGGTGTTMSGWTNDNDTPYSAAPYYASSGNEVYILSSGAQGTTDTTTNLAGCTNTGKSADECLKYRVGNYYNFAAANATNSVASTVGHTVADADSGFVMPDSICPAGWRLPHGITGFATNGQMKESNSEFDNLLYLYGITPIVGATKSQNVGFTNATAAVNVRAGGAGPLYFVRSGVVNGGTLVNRGAYDYSWSSTISATSNGYYLVFGATTMYPAANDGRFDGFPLRCLVR